MVMNLREIQDDIIQKYRIKLDTHSTCYRRTHAHVKERRICKWIPKSSFQSTFTLLHEVGHIETTKPSMRRSESEYYATCWAIDKCREYGLKIPEKELYDYQEYVLEEIRRGQRRHGGGYGILDLYWYAGMHKTKEEMKKLFPRYESIIDEWEKM